MNVKETSAIPSVNHLSAKQRALGSNPADHPKKETHSNLFQATNF